MIDPNTAPQVVQVHPSWFDWVTVAAIVLGPILALFSQRAVDYFRAKSKARLQLYFTVMAHRSTWLSPESLRALNSIDVVFSRKRDKPIRDAWEALIRHVYTPAPDANVDEAGARDWNARLWDVRVDLYQLIGNAVGHKHTVDYIKTHMYYPQYHVDAEQENTQIRKQFAKAITDKGLKVIVAQQQ